MINIMIDEEAAKIGDLGIDFDRIGSILKSLKQKDETPSIQEVPKAKEIVPRRPEYIIGIDFEKIVKMEPTIEMMSYIEVKMVLKCQDFDIKSKKSSICFSL